MVITLANCTLFDNEISPKEVKLLQYLLDRIDEKNFVTKTIFETSLNTTLKKTHPLLFHSKCQRNPPLQVLTTGHRILNSTSHPSENNTQRR